MNYKIKIGAKVIAKTGNLGSFGNAIVVRVDELIHPDAYDKYKNWSGKIKPGTYGIQFGDVIDTSLFACNFWAYKENVKLRDEL